MTVRLLYGRHGLEIDLPQNCQPTLIEKPPMPVIEETMHAVHEALDGKYGARLSDLARGKGSACVLICDITRPVPNGLFLRPIIERLMGAGVPQAKISVLVATGLHRPNVDDELAELVGDPWVLQNVVVENHFAEDDAAHVHLGYTARNTPIRIDRRFIEADLRIVTGLVEPHFMAGWSGGRKVIAPGIAHAETIRTFHNSRFMSDPRAVSCVLDGNPLHEEQLETAARVGACWALNVVIDDQRQPAFINFGEIVASHLEAVAFVDGYARVEVTRRFKTVVTSAAGYPLDKTYYQTVKGLVGPLDILEPGGDLIIASECSEGLGSKSYARVQERLVELGVDGFWHSIRDKDLADIDEWQTQMQLKPMRKARIHLYSGGLSDADTALTGVEPITSIGDAIASAISRHGDGEVAFVPEGPYVVPKMVQA
ncbi:MAG: nickel-dependent lactate racemase [Pseudomonadota bacterium]